MKQPSLIAVDIGNTTTSVGIFADVADSFPLPNPVIQFDNAETEFASLREYITSDQPKLFIGSVCQVGLERFLKFVEDTDISDSRLLANHELPIEISVEFPDKVGIDRLLASLAAYSLNQQNIPSIVIDAGSAITIDVTSAGNEFLGGVIFPGLRMQTGALYQQTDQLPLIDANFTADPPSIIGRNTESAIKSGVFWGAIGSIREIVQRLQSEVGESKIFLTGGDLETIAHLVPDAEYVPNLVLSGIAITARRILSNANG